MSIDSEEAITMKVSADVHAAVQEIARRAGRDPSNMANELLGEAVKMLRVPGIVFADGPTGRRARVAGTGIEVFEVIRSYRAAGEGWADLRKAYHWLSEFQLRAALSYADAFPDEIENFLRDDVNEEHVLAAFWAAYPKAKPRQD